MSPWRHGTATDPRGANTQEDRDVNNRGSAERRAGTPSLPQSKRLVR